MAQADDVLRVVIATPLGPGGQGGMDRLTDLVVETLKKRTGLKLEVLTLTTRGQGSIRSGAFVFARAIAQFWATTQRREVDLLHINLAAGGSVYRKLMLSRIALHSKVPYVVHLHAGRFHEFWASSGPFTRRAIERLFMESRQIIVLGHIWQRLVIDHLPKVQDKVTILPNATKSIAGRPETSGPVHISFLGRLVEAKGAFDLIEALGRLRSFGNWKATIAGNGELEKCIAQVNALGIADRVNIPGGLNSREVDNLLSGTDIFVLPSAKEGLPMAILEAFAFGLAVVATPVGAIPEVIDHGRNGLIVPVSNVDALADALQRLIRDPELRNRLGNAARNDHAKNYDIDVYVTRLETIWRDSARAIRESW